MIHMIVSAIVHGLIYRWAATRLSEARIDDFLARAGESLAASFSTLRRRLATRRADKP